MSRKKLLKFHSFEAFAREYGICMKPMRFLAAPSQPNDETDKYLFWNGRTYLVNAGALVHKGRLHGCVLLCRSRSFCILNNAWRQEGRIQEDRFPTKVVGWDRSMDGEEERCGNSNCIDTYKYVYIQCYLLTGSIATNIANKVPKLRPVWANRKRARANSGWKIEWPTP